MNQEESNDQNSVHLRAVVRRTSGGAIQLDSMGGRKGRREEDERRTKSGARAQREAMTSFVAARERERESLDKN
ncbi:hypothetical protein ACOSQ2_002628 [Xanthoceras sorbifolium]